MKKFKALASMLCMCTALATPLTSLAATPATVSATESNSIIAPYSLSGRIIGTNVQIRRASNISDVLGQVGQNDTYTMEDGTKAYYNNNEYRKVTMTSGVHKGTTGWICIAYLSAYYN